MLGFMKDKVGDHQDEHEHEIHNATESSKQLMLETHH